MSAPFGGVDPEQWIDNLERSATEQAAKAAAMADEVAGIEVSASSSDGAVEVSVGPSGVLMGLRLSEQIRSYSSGELAAQILHVVRRAQAKLAGRVSAIAARTLGSDSPAAVAVIASYEQRFPPPAAADNEAAGDCGRQRGRGR